MGISKTRVLTTVALSVALIIVAAEAGRFLVIDNPRRSDFILVLAGDSSDSRIGQGLTLLRNGYGQQLILDAPDWILYGRNQSEAAEDYLRTESPDRLGPVHVCKFSSDSTRQEMMEVATCIHRLAPSAQSGIIVTSDFHTRRALETAERVLPQYRWSVGATRESGFDVHWWRNRESAKIAVTEWQKLLWWTVVERWAP